MKYFYKLLKSSIFTFFLPFIIYLVFYLVTMPKFLYLRSDDFGYLDSLIVSIKSGKILTSQFLEPPNLFSTTISLVFYGLSGSLYLSVWLPVTLSSLGIFIILRALFKKIFSRLMAILLIFFIITLPTVVNITFDASGVIASWFLFISALYFWDKNQKSLFFLCAFLASINRQSNIILYLLPVFRLIMTKEKKQSFTFFLVLISLLFTFLLIFGRQNQTLAQTQSILNPEIFSLRHLLTSGLSTLTTGLAFFLLSQNFYFLLSMPNILIKALKKNLSHLYLPFSASILFGFAIFLIREPINFQTPILNVGSTGLPVILVLLFISIWFFPWNKLENNVYLLSSLAYIFLNVLRGQWFDYYFFELIILSFFCFRQVYITNKEAVGKSNFSFFILLPLLFLNLIYYINFKYYLDLEGLKVRLYETALRKKQIKVSSIGEAPFGYIAWKLFHYYQKNEEKPLTGFLCYLKKDIDVHLTVSDTLKSANYFPGLIQKGRYRLGFSDVNYTFWQEAESLLVSKCIGRDSDLPAKLGGYQNIIFPLNESEWQRLLKS